MKPYLTYFRKIIGATFLLTPWSCILGAVLYQPVMEFINQPRGEIVLTVSILLVALLISGLVVLCIGIGAKIFYGGDQ